jgi:hypothetical protein
MMHILRLALIAATTAVSASGLHAAPPAESPLPVFHPEQVQGETRLTLLEIARVTSFSSEYLVREAGENVRAIPGLKIVFRVERLGHSGSNDLHEGGVSVLVEGKPLSNHPMVIAGGNSLVEPVKRQLQTGFHVDEKGDEGSPVMLCCEYIRGLSVPAGRAQLVIRVGFDKLHDFKFENVPIQ